MMLTHDETLDMYKTFMDLKPSIRETELQAIAIQPSVEKAEKDG